jgi:hypothetical protein
MAVRLSVIITGRALFPTNIISMLLVLISLSELETGTSATGRIRQIETIHSPHQVSNQRTFGLLQNVSPLF